MNHTIEEVKEAFEAGRNYMLSLKVGDIYYGPLPKMQELYGKERCTLGEIFMIGSFEVMDDLSIHTDETRSVITRIYDASKVEKYC